jgi:hypothetical protein
MPWRREKHPLRGPTHPKALAGLPEGQASAEVSADWGGGYAPNPPSSPVSLGAWGQACSKPAAYLASGDEDALVGRELLGWRRLDALRRRLKAAGSPHTPSTHTHTRVRSVLARQGAHAGENHPLWRQGGWHGSWSLRVATTAAAAVYTAATSTGRSCRHAGAKQTHNHCKARMSSQRCASASTVWGLPAHAYCRSSLCSRRCSSGLAPHAESSGQPRKHLPKTYGTHTAHNTHSQSRACSSNLPPGPKPAQGGAPAPKMLASERRMLPGSTCWPVFWDSIWASISSGTAAVLREARRRAGAQVHAGCNLLSRGLASRPRPIRAPMTSMTPGMLLGRPSLLPACQTGRWVGG